MFQATEFPSACLHEPAGEMPMVYPVRMRDVPAVAVLYHRIWHEIHGSHMPWAEREARDEAFFLDRVASLMPNNALWT